MSVVKCRMPRVDRWPLAGGGAGCRYESGRWPVAVPGLADGRWPVAVPDADMRQTKTDHHIIRHDSDRIMSYDIYW